MFEKLYDVVFIYLNYYVQAPERQSFCFFFFFFFFFYIYISVVFTYICCFCIYLLLPYNRDSIIDGSMEDIVDYLVEFDQHWKQVDSSVKEVRPLRKKEKHSKVTFCHVYVIFQL